MCASAHIFLRWGCGSASSRNEKSGVFSTNQQQVDSTELDSAKVDNDLSSSMSSLAQQTCYTQKQVFKYYSYPPIFFSKNL